MENIIKDICIRSFTREIDIELDKILYIGDGLKHNFVVSIRTFLNNIGKFSTMGGGIYKILSAGGTTLEEALNKLSDDIKIYE